MNAVFARFRFVCACVAGLLAATPAGAAQPSPSPAPANAPPAPAACPAAVLRFVPLDFATGSGRMLAVAFETFAPTPGRLAGTVSLFAGDRRYDVPFSNAVAVSATYDGAKTAAPIVIHIPDDVAIDAAYLSAIEGPNAGPCDLGYVAQRSRDRPQDHDLSELDRLLRARAQGVKPIDAPAGVRDPVTCATPNVPEHTAFAATPRYPDLAGQRGDTGETQVAVAVGADDDILAAWIWKTSGSADLDKASLTAAYASRFTAETFRCKRVVGLYLFYADFAQ